MSLAPGNIATHAGLSDLLCATLRALPGPVTLHVWDGRQVEQRVAESEIETVVAGMVRCRFVYALQGMRGIVEPVATFTANESLGNAQLCHLLDDQPTATNGKLPRRTTETLGIYIRQLLADNEWLSVVKVPAVIDSLHGQFGLSVTFDSISKVTLADASHRPRTSREWD